MRLLVWISGDSLAGGMERVAISLANGLAERGTEVVLAGPLADLPGLAEKVSSRVRRVFVGFQSRVGAVLKAAYQLHRLVRDYRIDIVSAHGSLFPVLAAGAPVVWTEHGTRYGKEPILSGLRTAPWLLIRRRLRTGAWTFVGCSEFVRDSVCRDLGLPHDIAPVIQNGVPGSEGLRSLAPPVFRPPYRVALIGRLDPEKHPLDIFVLDQKMAARGVPVEWHVWGRGALEEQMRKRAAGAPRVHLRGLAADAEQALAGMDAMAFLSHGLFEGLPTVILEARLARRPVVAWDVPVNAGVVGPADLLVPPFDLDRFADGIQEVLRRGVPGPPVPQGEISYGSMIAKYEHVLLTLWASRAKSLSRAATSAMVRGR